MDTDDPLVPLHLLVFAAQAALTTATCIIEFLAWEDVLMADKMQLTWLYGPYLVLGRWDRSSSSYYVISG